MTESSPEILPLAAEFPTVTRTQWRALVESVLKGRPFDALTSRTYDGLGIEPLYGRAVDTQPLPGRGARTAWQILQRADHPDPAAANAEALHDLANGATGLNLVFAGASGAYGYGLPPTVGAVERALDGVDLDGASIDIDLTPSTNDAALAVARLVVRGRIAPEAVDIRFGFDPLGAGALAGEALLPRDALSPILAEVVHDLDAQGFRGPFASADGRIVHNAGGSEAQELAYVLSVAVAYLRALEAGGIALDAARRMIYIRLAADADQFLTTAKFRAIRALWARVEEACGLTPEPLFVSGETAWRMMTRRDPYVNILRATVATFSAAIGGANAITVLPFTMALGLPDRFARRIARNTQLILAEEAHLAVVDDPAAGSGAIESLTTQLCRAAWALFQEIESAGGAAAALAHGLIQEKVARVRAERERAVAHRRDALTGTSEFPLLSETPVAVLDVAPVTLPPSRPAAETFPKLTRMRTAQPFEALRDASDHRLAETGARPRIFLAVLGSPSDFLARATFAKNFFEAGGIETVQSSPPLPAGEVANQAILAEAFKASGSKIACLCSSDAIYAAEALAAAATLKVAGARHIYLAGRPGEREAELTAAGVDSFIFVGSDVMASLVASYAVIEAA